MSDEQVAAARQSLAVAIRAQKEGDEEKAKRFVEKSLRLHPTAEAKKLQRQLNGETVDENAAPPQPAASEDTTRGTGAAGGRCEPKRNFCMHKTYFEISSNIMVFLYNSIESAAGGRRRLIARSRRSTTATRTGTHIPGYVPNHRSTYRTKECSKKRILTFSEICAE